MIADTGKRYTLVPEETIPSKAKSVKSLISFAKRSAQLAAGFVCAIALAAGVPTVAGAQVLTTDNVCGKTADARGITAENLPDIDATNALVMGKDGTVYYGRGADEQVTKITCAGGSSSVLSSALNAAVVSMWTSSMI